MRRAQKPLFAGRRLSMLWTDAGEIKWVLENTFNAILQARMHDVPIVNPALAVEATDFARVNADWVGILITPWFMNLLLLPSADSEWTAHSSGQKFELSFPYGVFEFTAAEESQLGRYAQCSLFSPMFQFQNQADAREAALAAFRALLTPATLSRRDLIRGQLGKR